MPVEALAYSSVEDADEYFDTRFHVSNWISKSDDEKQQLLNDATRFIDLFNYIGSKTDPDQAHEFPRSGILDQDETLVPSGIFAAQYEYALALANGFESDREARNLRVTSRGFSSVRTTYDTRSIPEWQLFGFPNQAAWAYLWPYFNRTTAGIIHLHRVQ